MFQQYFWNQFGFGFYVGCCIRGIHQFASEKLCVTTKRDFGPRTEMTDGQLPVTFNWLGSMSFCFLISFFALYFMWCLVTMCCYVPTYKMTLFVSLLLIAQFNFTFEITWPGLIKLVFTEKKIKHHTREHILIFCSCLSHVKSTCGLLILIIRRWHVNLEVWYTTFRRIV